MLPRMLIAKTVYRIEDPNGAPWPEDQPKFYREKETAEKRAREEGEKAGARPGYLRAAPCFVGEIVSEKGPSVFVLLGAPVVLV